MAGKSVNPAPVSDNDGWELVTEESATKVVFDSFGDIFTGVKVNVETIAPEGEDPFVQVQFRGYGEFPTETLFGINESYKLSKLADIPNGMVVKVIYVKDVPVGKGNDMKDFRIFQRPLKDTEKRTYGF